MSLFVVAGPFLPNVRHLLCVLYADLKVCQVFDIVHKDINVKRIRPTTHKWYNLICFLRFAMDAECVCVRECRVCHVVRQSDNSIHETVIRPNGGQGRSTYSIALCVRYAVSLPNWTKIKIETCAPKRIFLIAFIQLIIFNVEMINWISRQ